MQKRGPGAPHDHRVRVTKEMNERLSLMVAMSGLTKQDYIMSKLCDTEITVVPSPRALKALRDEMREVCKQLNRLRKGDNPSEHLLETCDLLADVMLGAARRRDQI